MLPPELAANLQKAAAKEDPNSYFTATEGHRDILSNARAQPHPENDLVFPMIFYQPDTIPKASYYVRDSPSRVLVCDVDGNELKVVELTALEKMAPRSTRVGCMLDPTVRDKSRPRKVKISEHPTQGRCLYYFDSKDRLMHRVKYCGGATFEEIWPWTTSTGGKSFDFEWMISNGVVVEGDTQPRSGSLFSSLIPSWSWLGEKA